MVMTPEGLMCSTLARRSGAGRAARPLGAGAAAIGVRHGLQPFLLDGLAADCARGVPPLFQPPQCRLQQAQLLLRRLGNRAEDVVGLALSHLLGEIRAQGIGLVSQVSAGSARPRLQLFPALEQACAYRLYVHRSLPASAGAMLVRNINLS